MAAAVLPDRPAVQPVPWAAARQAARERMQVALLAAALLVVPAACRAEVLVARLAAVECKAAVPQVGPALLVAAPRVVLAVSRRPGAEPPAVVPKVEPMAVRRAAAQAAV